MCPQAQGRALHACPEWLSSGGHSGAPETAAGLGEAGLVGTKSGGAPGLCGRTGQVCLRKSVAWQGSTTYQLRTGRGLMGSHDAGPGWGAVCPPGQRRSCG